LKQVIRAVGWDPENLLSTPQGGHIARRQLTRDVENNKELQAEVDKLKAEKEAELKKQRDARPVPSTHAELIEYFLSTEGGEMQFETARMRPMVTDEFFDFLSKQISSQRFTSRPDESRVAELEGLQTFLKDATALIDDRAQQLAKPMERMKKLLSAQDKRAMLMEMAGNNEIDQGLLDLLQQNIHAARAAGQDDPALFMEKIRDAARKFTLTPSKN